MLHPKNFFLGVSGICVAVYKPELAFYPAFVAICFAMAYGLLDLMESVND